MSSSAAQTTTARIRFFAPPSPSFTSFDNLLIMGPYAPTAPLHLCLSYLGSQHNAQQRIALLLSPDRKNFTSALEEYNEDWLSENCMKGSVARVLSNIKILYPPTLEHWLLTLSLLRPVSRAAGSNCKSMVLSDIPSLVVLHEPSRCFQSTIGQELTLSEYLHLVTLAMDTAAYFSGCDPEIGRIPVVLFDSGLESLRLPIVKSIARHRTESPKRLEGVDKLVAKYFTTVAKVEDTACSSSQPDEVTDADPVPFQCTITRSLENGTRETTVWRWTEQRQYDDSSGQLRTVCCFE